MEKVNIGQKILQANDVHAIRNQRLLEAKKLLCYNLISSPGSGKTTLLVRTIGHLKGRLRWGVIEGDIQTEIDAERIRTTEAPAIQINTDGACHLSAAQVLDALGQLPLDTLDGIFIENVGNLVCPGAFELGEQGKIVVLSVAEGDDKPAKYPAIFAMSRVVLINKIDYLAAGFQDDFDIDKVKQEIRRLNKQAEIFCVSAKTGEGLDAWCDWLVEQKAQR